MSPLDCPISRRRTEQIGSHGVVERRRSTQTFTVVSSPCA
jgi:hypothetical protein